MHGIHFTRFECQESEKNSNVTSWSLLLAEPLDPSEHETSSPSSPDPEPMYVHIYVYFGDNHVWKSKYHNTA